MNLQSWSYFPVLYEISWDRLALSPCFCTMSFCFPFHSEPIVFICSYWLLVCCSQNGIFHFKMFFPSNFWQWFTIKVAILTHSDLEPGKPAVLALAPKLKEYCLVPYFISWCCFQCSVTFFSCVQCSACIFNWKEY